jgi:Protein of unknown function (DUF3099)
MKRAADDQVHLVTSAQQPHSQEMSGRAQRYLISMAIRTVCLILAIFVATGVLRWVFVGLAVLLPYVAVILANAGPVHDSEQPEFVTFTHPALDAHAARDDESERIA